MAVNCLKPPFNSPLNAENLYDSSPMQTSAKAARALKFMVDDENSQEKPELN